MIFYASKILNEIDTGFRATVYKQDNIIIKATPNWSDERILCFSVQLFSDRNKDPDDFKLCRVSMTEPKYIGAENEELVLNKEQILKIINILENKCTFANDGSTVWQEIIYQINHVHDCDDDPVWELIPEDLPIPNYLELLNN